MLLLLAILLRVVLASGARTKVRHCPTMVTSRAENWTELANKKWLEVGSYPGTIPTCVVREYFPNNKTMRWTQRKSYDGPVLKEKRYMFDIQGSLQILQKDGRFFQQVLDTDNEAWAFLHICSRNDGISKLILTALDPWALIPRSIMSKIRQAMLRGGMSRPVELATTPCARELL